MSQCGCRVGCRCLGAEYACMWGGYSRRAWGGVAAGCPHVDTGVQAPPPPLFCSVSTTETRRKEKNKFFFFFNLIYPSYQATAALLFVFVSFSFPFSSPASKRGKAPPPAATEGSAPGGEDRVLFFFFFFFFLSSFRRTYYTYRGGFSQAELRRETHTRQSPSVPSGFCICISVGLVSQVHTGHAQVPAGRLL